MTHTHCLSQSPNCKGDGPLCAAWGTTPLCTRPQHGRLAMVTPVAECVLDRAHRAPDRFVQAGERCAVHPRELLDRILDRLVTYTRASVGRGRLIDVEKAVKQRKLLADQERPLAQLRMGAD